MQEGLLTRRVWIGQRVWTDAAKQRWMCCLTNPRATRERSVFQTTKIRWLIARRSIFFFCCHTCHSACSEMTDVFEIWCIPDVEDVAFFLESKFMQVLSSHEAAGVTHVVTHCCTSRLQLCSSLISPFTSMVAFEKTSLIYINHACVWHSWYQSVFMQTFKSWH